MNQKDANELMQKHGVCQSCGRSASAVDCAPFKPPFRESPEWWKYVVIDARGQTVSHAEIVRMLNAAAGEGKA